MLVKILLLIFVINNFVASYRERGTHFCSHLLQVKRQLYAHEYKICSDFIRRQRLYNDRRRRFVASSSYVSPGKNGAASNDGILIKWEKVTGWGRRKRSLNAVDRGCCSKIRVSALGKSAKVQWNRLGVYTAVTHQIHNGRMVYGMPNNTQKLYYLNGRFDGWLLGPRLGHNYGGIKNSHDGMCVHEAPSGWGYYDGPENIDNPEEAYPFWKYDDKSLDVACVSQSVSIHTEMVPDQTRGPALVNVYRRARPMLLKKCGPRPQEGEKINVDIWLVRASCAGKCGKTTVSLKIKNDIADILIIASYSELDIKRHCIKCYPFWAGRISSIEPERTWSTIGKEADIVLHVMVVGYTSDKLILDINMDSSNILSLQAEKLKL